ncbi:MAG: flippase-like domain-containing protein [Chloroflexi bacterium]|nr:flippase-like domain-containing protein [Chloroflexota bacterium]
MAESASPSAADDMRRHASSRFGLRRLISDWQFWLGIFVSLFFLYWAFRQVNDLGNVGRAIASANYVYAIPALIAYFLGVAVRAVRWRLLLQPIKSLSARKLFPVVVIGYMANDVLPARMGELVRVYVLGRDEGISKTAGLATVFVERVFDGLTMLLFIAVVALFVPLGAGLENVVRIAGIVLVAMMLSALAIAASPRRARGLVAVFLPIVPAAARPRVISFVDRFLEGLAVLQSGRAMLVIFALSILAWLFEATMYYVLGAGFALGTGPQAFLLTTAVANLGTMVPSSPGYVGTFEALAVFTLGRFGVASDLALSYTVALHAVLLVPITLLGFFYMWRRHVSLSLAKETR